MVTKCHRFIYFIYTKFFWTNYTYHVIIFSQRAVDVSASSEKEVIAMNHDDIMLILATINTALAIYNTFFKK